MGERSRLTAAMDESTRTNAPDHFFDRLLGRGHLLMKRSGCARLCVSSVVAVRPLFFLTRGSPTRVVPTDRRLHCGRLNAAVAMCQLPGLVDDREIQEDGSS